jgi:GT2 family glycosyltransferase
MDEIKKDLTICQDCGQEPALYGDGETWARGSACQFKYNRAQGISEPKSQESVEQSFAHTVREGLVSIILPVYMNNYTLFHYTGNCIGSVREHTYKEDYELVIVDNGSPIQPPELTSYYAHRVIKNETNLGVTKAWNQGIRMSIGEYIVLLNNDVQVFDGWLVDMKAAIDRGEADLVMAHPMYSRTEPFARAIEAGLVRAGKKKLDALERDFSCVMFKRSLVEKIGLFDERFFNYCSDSDFLRRMDEAGYTWKILDQVATSHISDATGFSIAETPGIMDKDKLEYIAKLEEAKERTVTPPVVKHKAGKTVRTPETGDAIYYVANGRYHHVTSPDVLHALGFNFGDEMTIPISELVTMGENGEAITMQNYEKLI